MKQRKAEKVNCSGRDKNAAEKGERGFVSGNSIFGGGSEGSRVVSRSYEERVTYRTITKSEFQKRRASFENKEVKREATSEVRLNCDTEKKTGGKAGTIEELRSSMREGGDPYRIQAQEREMTEKLKDIHRMISDMQELTRQLKKDENGGGNGIASEDQSNVSRSLTSNISGPEDKAKALSRFKSRPDINAIRYRSTVLIDIASKWRRFREEVEFQLES